MQVNTNTILIHGKQGSGKTIFAVMLALDYIGRIYGNVTIKKDDISIVNFLSDMSLLDYLTFEKKAGVILFDEVGLNFNSKEFGTDKNKQLSKFFFLVRKYNLSSIFISQRFDSIPVDMRQLADYIFEVNIVYRKKKTPLFKITRQFVNQDGKLEFYDEFLFDIIKYLQKKNIFYNTLESSIIK